MRLLNAFRERRPFPGQDPWVVAHDGSLLLVQAAGGNRRIVVKRFSSLERMDRNVETVVWAPKGAREAQPPGVGAGDARDRRAVVHLLRGQRGPHGRRAGCSCCTPRTRAGRRPTRRACWKCTGGDVGDPASWQKLPRPFFTGGGHGCVVDSPTGTHLVYHRKVSGDPGWSDREIRVAPLVWDASGFPVLRAGKSRVPAAATPGMGHNPVAA